MFVFIIEVVVWVLCIYGLFSLIQDYINFNMCKKIGNNINFIMTVKNAQNGIEEFLREISYSKIFCKKIKIIDLDSEDDTLKILHNLEKEKFNIQVLTKEEGQKFVENIIK